VRHNTPHPRELRARHGGKAPPTRKDTGDVTPPPLTATSDLESAAANSPGAVS